MHVLISRELARPEEASPTKLKWRPKQGGFEEDQVADEPVAAVVPSLPRGVSVKKKPAEHENNKQNRNHLHVLVSRELADPKDASPTELKWRAMHDDFEQDQVADEPVAAAIACCPKQAASKVFEDKGAKRASADLSQILAFDVIHETLATLTTSVSSLVSQFSGPAEVEPPALQRVNSGDEFFQMINDVGGTEPPERMVWKNHALGVKGCSDPRDLTLFNGDLKYHAVSIFGGGRAPPEAFRRGELSAGRALMAMWFS